MSNYGRYRLQPLKAGFFLYEALSTLLVRVPFWFLKYLHPSFRPRRTWTVKQALLVSITRRLARMNHLVGPLDRPDYTKIVPGKGVNGVWVDPVDPSCIVGEVKQWASAVDVKPIRLPGYWIHAKGSHIPVGSAPVKGEKVVYALHGGGYNALSAHPTSAPSNIARGLISYIDKVERVFSIEYRLSRGPPLDAAHPFPTALIDALTGYNYLVNCVGVSPSDIIVEGDSAGGNLALALVRYLVENRDLEILPPPSSLILSSPWCDLSSSNDTPTSSVVTCINSDYITVTGSGYSYLISAFVGAHGIGMTETNRYISPASLFSGMPRKDRFKGFPRTFIICGGAEALRDQIRTLGRMMKEDLGDEMVKYYEAEDAVHDYPVFTFWEPERSRTFEEVDRWVRND